MNDLELFKYNSINYLGKFISFPSYSHKEDELAEFIETGINFLVEKATDIYPKTIIPSIERIGNSVFVDFDLGQKETIMLVGHLDVVHEGDKAKWTGDPFQMVETEDRYIGRGVTDMKGFDAIMYAVAMKLLGEKSECNYNIKLLFYDKEEIGDSAIVDMLQDGTLKRIGENVDFAIVGEPTNKQIHNGVFGFVGQDAEIMAEGGHSSFINIETTIYNKLESIIHIARETQKEYPQDLVLNLTRLEVDNGSFNTIPSSLKICINARFSYKLTTEKVREIIKKIAGPDAKLEEFNNSPSGYCPEDIAKRFIGDLDTEIARYWSDIAILNQVLPAVNWGPGSIQQAHTYDEFLMKKDYDEYIEKIYNLLFM